MNIKEDISVIVSFGLPYRIKPVRFRWQGRLFEVKEITYAWQTMEGSSRLYHFSVYDGRTLYELSFNADSLLWKLESLEA